MLRAPVQYRERSDRMLRTPVQYRERSDRMLRARYGYRERSDRMLRARGFSDGKFKLTSGRFARGTVMIGVP
jgi:hypothetical protein